MAAFVSFHAWHSVPRRQFAPSWHCMHEPLSDYHAFKATALWFNLSDGTGPPVVATGRPGFTERRCINAEFLKGKLQIRLFWKDRFGYCAPLKPVTTVQKSANPCLEPSKLPAKAVSFRLASAIMIANPQRQEIGCVDKDYATSLYQPSPYSLGMMARWAPIVSTPLDFKEDV